MNSPEFDQQCSRKARERALSSNKSDSSATTTKSSPYEVPRLEAHLYYAGVSPKERGPKLVYRTSSDVCEEPSDLEAYRRLIRVIAVPDDHEFGKDDKWDTVCDKVRVPSRYTAISSLTFVPRWSSYSTRGT